MERKQPLLAVVGGINMDISGTPEKTMLYGDSNPGHVRFSPGGVGRNIAENLCRLGARVTMYTALGDDASGLTIRKACREFGLDLSPALAVPDLPTSTYLCLNTPDGDLYAAVSDMDICQRISPAYLALHLDELNRMDAIVADANLPEESLTYLAEHCTVPLLADPVSVSKAPRLKSCLHRLAAMKPNRREAEVLTGLTIRTEADMKQAANALLELGLERVFISLGENGVYYADARGSGRVPICPGEIVNTNGCGDAFISAVALGCSEGAATDRLALMGVSAAAVCAESPMAVSPDMSRAQVINKMQLITGGEKQ